MNTPNNPSSPSGDSIVAMVQCSDCGHMVPESNLAIHQAHACGGRARPPSSANHISHGDDDEPSNSSIRQRRRTIHTNTVNTATNNALPVQPTAPSETELQQQNEQDKRKQEYQHKEEVIDLASDDDDDDDDDDDEVQVLENNNEWSCPRCTLLNPNSTSTCGACQYHKISQQHRAADPTRQQERLVAQQQQSPQPPSPGTFVGGGALLGSVIGAAGAAFRGDSIVGGAMEGAVSGAVGGAVLGSTSQQMAMQRQQQQQQYGRQQRQRQQQQQPRSSFRVYRSDSGHHTTTTIFSPDGRVQRRVVAGGPGGVDPLLGFLMANAMQNSPQQYHGMNIDGMSYEQLLETFGDGSENRGASQETISSLPVSRVAEDTPPEKQNEDYAKCPICLEAFQKGDARMTLPCLHGFHDKCVSKWLRANGSCPICKHSVSS